MRNAYEIAGDIVRIHLGVDANGEELFAKISVGDFERVNSISGSWFPMYNRFTKSYYVSGNLARNGGKPKRAQLHRWIMEPDVDVVIDHINHDTLDNRRENLRIATRSQNMQNRKGAQCNNKSGMRGVSWHKGDKKWRAAIYVNKKHIHLGNFNTQEEAAQAYNEAALFYFGEFANVHNA